MRLMITGVCMRRWETRRVGGRTGWELGEIIIIIKINLYKLTRTN